MSQKTQILNSNAVKAQTVITLYVQHKRLNHERGMAILVVNKNGLCMHAISSERGNNTLSVNLLLLIFMCVIG